MERWLLVVSTLFFLTAFAYTMFAIGGGRYQPSRFNFSMILCGFLLQTAFLYLRGQEIGRCPLTNLFEVLIFLSWAVALLYLIVGPVYRVSLLGAFTAPLVVLLQGFALVAPLDVARVEPVVADFWLELHAAVSIIAYGAFALACVAGAMYLAQERQLKTHHIHSIFYHLPPIADLAVVNRRLILIGFSLLSVGLAAGFAVGQPLPGKLGWGLVIWAIYGLIFLAGKLEKVTPRRVALLSVVAFAVALSTLWGVSVTPEDVS